MPLTSWMRQHIFVDFFILKFSQKVRDIFNIATRCLVIGLFLMVGWNMLKYARDLQKSGEVSLTLQMPFYPIAYGVGVCCFILCLVFLCDIMKIFRGNMMYEVMVGIIALGVVLALFLTGIELGFAMALVGFLGFSYLVSTKAALNLLAKDIFDVFASYGFTVIPLFILMGQIAFNAGIAKRLFNTAYRFIGHVPGEWPWPRWQGPQPLRRICGSSPATAATFASVAVPEMDRYGYDKKLSTGIVATVGTLGILIPPSVTLIVFGIITELSIGKLFLAGIIPGLIIAFFFIFIIYGWCKINPKLGPKGEKSTWKERIASLPEFATGRYYLLADDLGIDERAFYTYRGRERWDRVSPPFIYFKKRHQF